MTPQDAEPAFVLLGDAQKLEKAPLADYRIGVGLARGVALNPAANPALAAGASSAFYDAFWKPLVPALGGARRIYVSPDGALDQVAFDVVPTDRGRRLIDRYDLRIVNSTKDLLRQPHAAKTRTAALFGNPDFDLSPPRERVALAQLARRETQAAPAAQASSAGPGLSRDLAGQRLEPLPGTAAEVRKIAALLRRHGWKTQVYTGDEALKQVLEHLRAPRVLHLATHGFFESDQHQDLPRSRALGAQGPAPSFEDPMLRSGLYLAGANRTLAHLASATGLDDGVLTAYEATQLDLEGTQLVALSACDTGLGVEQNGEGVFGLRRALEEAGAQAVLMSMWSVPDPETQELMTRFYRNWLGGMRLHEALRQAELAERKIVRRRYGRDLPYYWGAFVLVGR